LVTFKNKVKEKRKRYTSFEMALWKNIIPSRLAITFGRINKDPNPFHFATQGC